MHVTEGQTLLSGRYNYGKSFKLIRKIFFKMPIGITDSMDVIIELLPLVSQHRANNNTRVLDDHLAGIDVALTEQAPPVDGRSAG